MYMHMYAHCRHMDRRVVLPDWSCSDHTISRVIMAESSFVPLRPPRSFADTLLDPTFLQLFFKVHVQCVYN